MSVAGMAVLWLHPEDYPRFREICGDVDDTYDEWRARMERRLKELVQQGVGDIERVIINPNEFAAWCEENGIEPNGQARAAYPAYLLASREVGRGGPVRFRP